MEHVILHKGTDYQSAFPDIARLANGDLLTVFRQAAVRPGHHDPAERRDERFRHYHLDPDSRIVAIRSVDDGLTWTDPYVIDSSDGTQDLNMPLITELRSGELVVINHRWHLGLSNQQISELSGERFVRPVSTGKVFGSEVFDSLYLFRSSDGGYTWSEPEPIKLPSFGYAAFIGKTAVVELPDGTWFMPVYGVFPGDRTDSYHLIRSRDGGSSWGDPSGVAFDPSGRVSFHEPPVLRFPDGRLLTMMRTAGADGYLYQAFSTDEGWTWQNVKRTPVWGFPCHLLRLHSGRILCSYGYRREPFGIRVVASEDGGETWDISRELVIRDDGIHMDLGYPASVELQNGRILTVYYFHGEDGLRYITGTIYNENEMVA